jgi:hypothetical protein
MHETVKFWIDELLEKHNLDELSDLSTDVIMMEIEDAKGTISNEHMWELGYDGNLPFNPHTENIAVLMEYIEVLEEKLEELK